VYGIPTITVIDSQLVYSKSGYIQIKVSVHFTTIIFTFVCSSARIHRQQLCGLTTATRLSAVNQVRLSLKRQFHNSESMPWLEILTMLMCRPRQIRAAAAVGRRGTSADAQWHDSAVADGSLLLPVTDDHCESVFKRGSPVECRREQRAADGEKGLVHTFTH